MPEGVSTYSYKSMKDRGSKHPKAISPGLQTVEVEKSASPHVMTGGEAGSTHWPGKVVRNSGKERYGQVDHKTAPLMRSRGGNDNKIPAEVAKHSGLQAPKSAK